MRAQPSRSSSTDATRSAPRGALRAAADLDELDTEIVRLLQHDGRLPFVEIARRLAVQTKTVSKRVAELRESGVIDITAVTDPRALGFDAAALIGLRMTRSKLAQDVVDELWKLPYVDYASLTGGRYDLIVEVVCRDSAELLDIVERDIVPITGARECEIYPYLSLYYQRFEYIPAQPRGDSGDKAGEQGVRVGSLEFDEVDQRIIAELNHDGRTPFEDIGGTLAVSESQVRRRVKRMVDSGGLRIIAMTNPVSLGFTRLAWVAIRVAPGATVRDVARRLSEVSAIIYIVVCSGRFDLFVDLVARDNDDLLTILDEQVRAVPGIDTVEAWVHLDLHWRPLRPLLDGAGRRPPT